MPKFNFRQFLIPVRCHRLDKSCEAQIPVPRKTRKRKPTYESRLLLSVYERLTKKRRRTAQLEEKLDGIVSLLTGAQLAAAPQDRTAGFPTLNKSSEESPVTNSASNLPSPLPWSRHPAPVAPRQETVLGTTQRSLEAFPNTNADQEANHLIEVFKFQMSPQFPFVVIPLHLRAHELRHEMPFLYRAVMVVASCKRVARQAVLRKEMMREICERVFMESEKSLELLEGLLVFVAW